MSRVSPVAQRLVAAVLVAFLALPAGAQFPITKVADTSTPIPNGTGNFTGFDHSPVVGERGIGFRGFGAGQEGVYVGGPTSLHLVADRNTIVPGTAGPFTSFGGVSGVGGNVVFNGSNSTRTGIYEGFSSGALLTIDDGPTASTVFGRVAGIDTSWVEPTTLVAYVKNGQILRGGSGITSTPFAFTPPAGVTELEFDGDPDLGGYMLGSGGSTPVAVSVRYTKNGQRHGGVAIGAFGATDRILFETPFGSPGPASINWSGAVAVEMESVGIGYVAFFEEGLIPIGAFTDFGTVSAGSPNLGPIDTHVVFVGQPASGGKGIFAVGRPYGLGTVVQVGQTFDGKIVQDVDLGRDSEFGVGAAFWVRFTDGSEGVYHAILPEPASLLMLISVNGVALLRLRAPARGPASTRSRR